MAEFDLESQLSYWRLGVRDSSERHEHPAVSGGVVAAADFPVASVNHRVVAAPLTFDASQHN